MKKLFAFILLSLFAASADAATFCIRADGTSTKANAIGPETDASKCMTVTTHNAATFAADDNITCSGLGGTNTIKLVPPSSGTSGHPITYTGTYGFTIDNNVDFDIRVNAKNYLTFNRITWTTKYASIVGASVGIIFNQCVGKASTAAYAMNIAGGSTVTVNNSVFHSNANAAIETTDTGNTITLRNNLVYGNNDDNAAIRIVDGNTVDYDYNLVIGNVYRYGALTENVIVPAGSDGGHNVTAYSPKVNGWRNGTAYFSVTVDDQGTSYARQLAEIMPSGSKMTMFVQSGGLTAQMQSDLQYMTTNGHEVAGHGYSHSDLSASTAFAITTTNANPTCDVDVPTTTITLATTTPGNTITLDWTGNKAISDLKTAVAGKGWTVTNTTNIQNSVFLSSLADSGGAQAVPYSPSLDKTANGMYYQNEITYAHSVLQSVTGQTVTTFSYPFGVYDAGAATYMKDNDILGARLSYLGEKSLSSLNIYKTYCPELVNSKGDGTEATIRNLAHNYYTWAKDNGYIVSFLAHTTSDFTIQQWGWLLDELDLLGAMIVPYRVALSLIRLDHNTADGLTYTKTYSDLSNYRLDAESMAIDAGAAVNGITTDLDGQAVPYSSAPDIGLYEHHDTFVYGKGRLSSGSGMTTVTRP